MIFWLKPKQARTANKGDSRRITEVTGEFSARSCDPPHPYMKNAPIAQKFCDQGRKTTFATQSAVGSISRCNTSIKSRSAWVSKPKVSRDRSLSCRATRLNCECAPPAVPQLLLGHRVEPSNISSTHRPSTPSPASDIKCCVDRLRPPPT